MRRASLMLSVPMVLLACMATTACATRYTVNVLTPLAGQSGNRFMNNSGQVVGASASNTKHMMFWNGTTAVDIGTLGGPATRVSGMNDYGQIVGNSDILPSGKHPIIYQNGTMYDVSSTESLISLTTMNINGKVVGSKDGDAYIFTWASRTLTPTTKVGDSSVTLTGINDKGQVSGFTQASSGITGFTWYNSTKTTVNSFAPEYINSRGLTAGRLYTSTDLYRPAIWDGKTVTQLENSATAYYELFGMNDKGQVVGTVATSSTSTSTQAVLWDTDGLHFLRTMVPSSAQCTPYIAWSINNAGQILCTGSVAGKSAAFILTPEPENPVESLNGLMMVSLPIVPANTDPKVVMAFDKNAWCGYNATTQAYVSYPSTDAWFTPVESATGRGFWARFAFDTPLPTGQAPTSDTLGTIQLSPGWNLIGMPYQSPLHWDTLRIKVQEAGKIAVPLRSSSSAMLPYAYGWQQQAADPYKGSYYLITDPAVQVSTASTLKPWQAYWVYAKRACTLYLPTPLK